MTSNSTRESNAKQQHHVQRNTTTKGSPPSKEELEWLAYAREQARKAPERVEKCGSLTNPVIFPQTGIEPV